MHIGNQVLRNRRGRSGGQDRHGATPELVPVRPISPHLAAGAVLLVALVAAACGSTPTSAVSGNTHAKSDTAHSAGSGTSASAAAIRSTTNATLGTILVNPAGATLYRLTTDKNGQSSCTGACAQIWPPFTVAAGSQPTAATGLAGVFGTSMRSDGTTQVTYNGSPLYTFSGDKTAGSTAGQGTGGVWFVVNASATPTSAPTATSAPAAGSTNTTTSQAPATPAVTPTTAPQQSAPTTPAPTSPPATSPPPTSPPPTSPPTTMPPPPTTTPTTIGYAY